MGDQGLRKHNRKEETIVTSKKKIFHSFIFLVVCFVYSAASGETIKRSLSCPQNINEREIMDKAIGQGKKMGYTIKQEEHKAVLSKTQVRGMILYKISLTIAPEGDGRKVLTIDGVARGDISLIGSNLNNDVTQIEKTVKTYLESR
jgi:hypothetical protein